MLYANVTRYRAMLDSVGFMYHPNIHSGCVCHLRTRVLSDNSGWIAKAAAVYLATRRLLDTSVLYIVDTILLPTNKLARVQRKLCHLIPKAAHSAPAGLGLEVTNTEADKAHTHNTRSIPYTARVTYPNQAESQGV